METLDVISNEQLADQIVTWAGRIAAGEARLLALIAEFDRREAWAGPGLLSCAHWLSWRTGLAPGPARERVRVARALASLPVTAAALSAGRLSWSQVRAVTRVASVGTEEQLVALARQTTAAQLERVVRGMRREQKVEEDAADPELAAWKLQARTRYDDDGNLLLTVKAPAEQAAFLLAALERARLELDAAGGSGDGVPAGPPDPGDPADPADPGNAADPGEQDGVPAGTPKATLAEGLVHLARAFLDHQQSTHPATARRRRADLTPHVDPLSGWARLPDGEFLPPGTLQGALRSLPGRGAVRLRPVTAGDLAAHDLGRTHRQPSLALRELLGILDGERCRFPGCTRHRRLHAHHVVYWSAGGATDLSNLVLLCGRHHTLVHLHGFQLRLADDRTLTVMDAAGTPLPHHPGLPLGDADELAVGSSVDAATLPPESVEARMDLRYVVSVMVQQAA